MVALQWEEARESIRRELAANSSLPAEQIPLALTNGRILATDIYSDRPYPPFSRSMRDGFAVKSANLPGQSFTGRVDVVSDSLDPSTHTVKARGSVVNDRRLLKAETFVTVEFTLPPEAGTEISSRAVFLRGERHCVLVEEAPGRYARREVTLGGQRGGRCLITDGIVSGQRVVVEGAILLERMLSAGSAS